MLGQKLLEAVFGDQAVRTLSERARRKLEVRIRALLEEERARYTDLLVSLGIDPASADRVRNASRRGRRPALRRHRTGRTRLPLGSDASVDRGGSEGEDVVLVGRGQEARVSRLRSR